MSKLGVWQRLKLVEAVEEVVSAFHFFEHHLVHNIENICLQVATDDLVVIHLSDNSDIFPLNENFKAELLLDRSGISDVEAICCSKSITHIIILQLEDLSDILIKRLAASTDQLLVRYVDDLDEDFRVG